MVRPGPLHVEATPGRPKCYSTKNDAPADEPLPVLFKYTPYLRTFTIFDQRGNNLIAGLFELTWWQRAGLRVRYWTSARGHLFDPLYRTRWLDRKPVSAVFSLLPTSYRFPAGSRLRITVTFADTDNFETPVIDPAPTVRLMRDSRRRSFVELPIVR